MTPHPLSATLFAQTVPFGPSGLVATQRISGIAHAHQHDYLQFVVQLRSSQPSGTKSSMHTTIKNQAGVSCSTPTIRESRENGVASVNYLRYHSLFCINLFLLRQDFFVCKFRRKSNKVSTKRSLIKEDKETNKKKKCNALNQFALLLC